MSKLFVKLFVVCLLTTASLTASSAAQTSSDDEDLQSWNDLQITVPLKKKVDLVLQAQVRLGGNVQRFIEGRGGIGVVWNISKTFSFSPSYAYVESRGSGNVFRTEHRVALRGTYKFPFKKFGLSHRSQLEFRFRASGNSWRYRPSLTIEKALPEKFIPGAKIYLTEEPFYVSTTGKFSRNRISIGLNKNVNKNLALDIYYLRQNDGYSHPGDLNVIGTVWKVRL